MQSKPSDRYPLEIKRGSSTVKIYKGQNRGKPFYTVVYVDSTGRKRETFTDPAEAKAAATARAEALARGDHAALQVTGDDARIYIAAREALESCGVAVDVAAREYAEAWKILGGSFIEAARHYQRTVLAGLPDISVAEAVAKYTKAKEDDGKSPLYLKDVRLLLGRFATAFHCQLRDVTSDNLRDYLTGLRVGPVTRNNHSRLLKGLFSHAKAHGWLDKSHTTAAEAITAAQAPIEDVEIYRPEDMTKLLQAADEDFRAWLVLIGFCGIRREEVSRLEWSAIDFDRACIVIPANVAKTKRKRKIDLQPNALAWLLTYRNKTGRIFKIDPRKRMAKAAKAAGVKWLTNGLRHSFCSYALESTRNAGQVALWAGNSAGIIMRHYHEIVTAEAAVKWWNLTPQTVLRAPENVIEIRSAA